MPTFVRKFLTDFIETGAAAVLGLQLVLPANVDDVKKVALAIGAALLGALIAAARRSLPDVIAYLKEKINGSNEELDGAA